MALCFNETEGTKNFLLNHMKEKDPARIFIPIIFGDIENFRTSEISEELRTNFFFGAALTGRVDIFEEAELRNIFWKSPQVLNGALFGGHLNILKWMIEKLRPLSETDFLDAFAFRAVVGEGDAEGVLSRERGREEGGGRREEGDGDAEGELSRGRGREEGGRRREEEREESLKWVFETQEYTWNLEPTKFAAAEGRTEYFDYILDHGISFDVSEVCIATATGAEWEPWNEGNIKILKWLKKKGFTCNPERESDVLSMAAKRKDHKVLRWLLQHGWKILAEKEEYALLRYFSDEPGRMSKEEYDSFKNTW